MTTSGYFRRIVVTQTFRRTAIASAIITAFAPATAVHAQNWGRNVELFAAPSTKRILGGGQFLQPLLQDNISLTYLDFRGVFSDLDTREFNLGLGYRRIVGDRRWILGSYAAFDTRESTSDRRHNQVTIGLEALSTRWDLRANFYRPVSDKKLVASVAGGPSGDPVFSGFDLIQPFSQGSNTFEEAMKGLDVEVGRLLPFISYGETRLFIGAYHFDGDTVRSTGTGLRTRLEFRPRKNITLGLAIKDDRLFGTQATFQISYSFGYKQEKGVRTLSERMIQFAERDIDVVETSRLPVDERTIIDTTTTTEIVASSNIIHIDNTADAGGDGSFEKPFNSLAACEAEFSGACGTNDPDSVVYVWAGDGTATGLDHTITLQDNQKLIGQGYAWMPVEGGGSIGGDAFPLLDPAGSDGIILANNNEVAGLKINNADAAIEGENVTGFNIHDNQLVDNAVGIAITAFTPDDDFTSEGVITGNTITGNAYFGIGLFNYAEYGATATQTISLAGNTVTGNNIGLSVVNSAYNNGTSAIQTIKLTDNKFNDNNVSNGAKYNAGAQFLNQAYDYGTATQNLTLTDNQFNNNNGNNSGNGIGIGASFTNGGVYGGTSTQTLNLTGNQFNNNYGYESVAGASFGNISRYGTSTQTINLTNNQFNDNLHGGGTGGGGKYINKYAGAMFSNISAYGTSTQTLSLTNNQFTGNLTDGGSGKYGSAGAFFLNSGKYDASAIQNIELAAGNSFSNNEGTGVAFRNSSKYYSATSQTLHLTGTNQFNDNEKFGLISSNFGVEYGNATQSLDLSGSNSFNNNGIAGIIGSNSAYFPKYDYEGTAIQSIDLSGTNQLTGNKYGVSLQNYASYGTATQGVDLTGADLAGNTGGGCKYKYNATLPDITPIGICN